MSNQREIKVSPSVFLPHNYLSGDPLGVLKVGMQALHASMQREPAPSTWVNQRATSNIIKRQITLWDIRKLAMSATAEP